MTGDQLKTFTENIAKVKIGEDFFYNLLNSAKEILEQERDWAFLVKLDESLSVSSGDTYTTAKSLPSDFISVESLYVGSDKIPFSEVPYAHRQRFQNLSRRFAVDYLNNNLYIMNSSPSGTIHLNYKHRTDDITSTGSPVFPAQFHKLLAFYTAGVHSGGVDWDSISARMSPEHKAQATLIRNNMITWDGKLKASMMGYALQGEVIISPNSPDRLDTWDI